MGRRLAATLPRPLSRIDYTLPILGYLGARNTAATPYHTLRRASRGDPNAKTSLQY